MQMLKKLKDRVVDVYHISGWIRAERLLLSAEYPLNEFLVYQSQKTVIASSRLLGLNAAAALTM